MRLVYRLKTWFTKRWRKIPCTGGLTQSDLDWIQRNLQRRAREDHGPSFSFNARPPRTFHCRRCQQPIMSDDIVFYKNTVRFPNDIEHWRCANPTRNPLPTLLRQ